MKRLTPTPLQFYVAMVVAIFVASWIVSSIVSMLLRPNVDSNAHAYGVLINAINQTYYSQMEEQARQAQSMTTDPDIRKFSDFVARAANINMRAGAQTVDEANSFSGFGKGFVAGFMNPLLGIEGGMMFIEGVLTDYETIGERIEETYQPVYQRYRFAEECGMAVLLFLFFGGFVAYQYRREECDRVLLEYLKRYRFVQINIRQE